MPPVVSQTQTIVEQKSTRGRAQRILSVVFFSIFLLGTVLFLLGRPPKNFPTDTIVTIHSGDTLRQLAQTLQDEGYVHSRVLFLNMITFVYREHNIAPGDYYFEKPISTYGIAWRIAFGKHGINQVRVTIPEGKNIFEIADIVTAKIPNIVRTDFIQKAIMSEGYLFPDTFFFYPSTTAEDALHMMQDLFTIKTKKIFTGISTDEEKKQIVIMASLIEKEARGDDDRAVIAGILWKRISIGMPLQVDATVEYADVRAMIDGVSKKESLYNTYTHKGLPPGPISNPGLLAIDAAIHPATSPYLYYLHDSRGSIHYARTFAEHSANIAKYLR